MIREQGKQPRLYACGSYDLFHHSHMVLFKKIKKLIPESVLIIGIFSDYDIRSRNLKSVMFDEERLKSI